MDFKNEKQIESFLKRLFPICRSITGEGVRQSLSILKEITDFEIKEIDSGTKCFDWTIPKEWNIDEAYIIKNNKKIIDFKKNNLHVMSYSQPINRTMKFEELKNHLHYLPKLKNAIPYRTSYYKKNWGFCISLNQFKKFRENEDYHVTIKSSLKKGKLNYGEYIIRGETDKEILFSTYCCHPSMANDNLSGMILWALLLKKLKTMKTKFTYRFIIIPETIGSIAYLHKNKKEMKKIVGGFVLTCVGGPERFSYKQTFKQNHFIDKIVNEIFEENNIELKRFPFDIRGSDERQFSSPYFRIPIGTICKSKYHEFLYYHTSKDDLKFVKSKNILDTFNIYEKIIFKLEKKRIRRKNNKLKESRKREFYSLMPFCEPMLSKRKLYQDIGGGIRQISASSDKDQMFYDAISWIMFWADGKTSLNQIYRKTGIPLKTLRNALEILMKEKLIQS